MLLVGHERYESYPDQRPAYPIPETKQFLHDGENVTQKYMDIPSRAMEGLGICGIHSRGCAGRRFKSLSGVLAARSFLCFGTDSLRCYLDISAPYASNGFLGAETC